MCIRDSSVIEARKTTGDDHLLILTHKGKGLRFHENQLRNQGRATRGVRGIRRREGDYVEAMLVVDDERLLLIAGTNGLGIRTEFSAFLPRGGEGEDGSASAGAEPGPVAGRGQRAEGCRLLVRLPSPPCSPSPSRPTRPPPLPVAAVAAAAAGPPSRVARSSAWNAVTSRPMPTFRSATGALLR